MKLHWKEQRLADTGERKRYVNYLFNESGKLLGYVKNTASGGWEGYIDAKIIGFYDTRAGAKRAVTTEAKFS